MWAHLILLLSPNRENHLAVIITSKQHYHSAIPALKASNFPRSYQDWYLLGFMSAWKPGRLIPAQAVSAQMPERGSLVSLEV